ncbi:MAG: polysaccharide biosynthesis protein [Chloroflexota bacterium]|nr:polysaccharide biosynthesis protein [Chloroflexota bacterium]
MGPAAAVDWAAVFLTYLVAVGVRTGPQFPITDALGTVVLALGAGAIQIVANIVFDIYWRDWSIAALEDLIALAKASALVACVLLLVNFVVQTNYIPTIAIGTGAALVLVVESAIKLRPRWGEIVRAAIGRSTGLKPAIVVGTGRTGQLLAQDLRGGTRGYRIACFVDDDKRKWGTYIRGIPVATGGVEGLPALLRRYSPSLVVIAVRNPAGALVRRVLAQCEDADVRVRAVSGFGLPDDDTSPLRPIGIEELLERQPVDLSTSDVREMLRGKRVLVTGAAGSIGSEISRLVSLLEPASLAVVDTNETGLHDLVQGLDPNAPVEMLLGDIKDRSWLAHVFAAIRPEVVFHAAAYKHVPILERLPLPGIATNVIGTANLLATAAAAGVERFIFISSDKAVAPQSVLGMTKRFGELLTLAYAHAGRRHYAVVRFGNVLGSSGSVVPLFTKQIDGGGPVTVTHPEITRYFMTVGEAAGLVLEAGAIARPGDILVLDMGKPIPIVELAEKMIRLRGLRVDTDVRIVFTGLRPGEKLHEDLFYPNESALDTSHVRVRRVEAEFQTPTIDAMQTLVRGLEEHLAPQETECLVALLRTAVTEPFGAETRWQQPDPILDDTSADMRTTEVNAL